MVQSRDDYLEIYEMYKDIADPVERQRLMKNERNRRWKKANRDKVRAARKRYAIKYPEKVKQESMVFRQEHPEYAKKWYTKHKEEAKEWWQNRSEEQKAAKAEYNKNWKNKQYTENTVYRLRIIISTSMMRSIKKNKTNKRLYRYLGYSIEELKEHLEHQFEDWMNWDNLGLTANKEKETWQIDHIIPVNTFNIKEIGPLDSYINNRRPKDGSDIKGIE